MKPEIFPPDYYIRSELPPLSDFGWRFLAEGDSWFTIGTLNVFAASNVLFGLQLARHTAIINCAYPGDTLQHIVSAFDDPYFGTHLYKPRFASYWEAILISAGGNDLIDAAQVPPVGADGQPTAADKRLLLTPSEAAAAGDAADPSCYISEPGWSAFAGYLTANFHELVRRRAWGPSHDSPIFCHTYAVPTVRPSGTVGAANGWLFPAFEQAGIAANLRQAICNELFSRLRTLLLSFDANSGMPAALQKVHVFDSAGLDTIVAAEPGATGSSNDWVNEIHLTNDGYRKLGKAFGAFIGSVLNAPQ